MHIDHFNAAHGDRAAIIGSHASLSHTPTVGYHGVTPSEYINNLKIWLKSGVPVIECNANACMETFIA